MEQNAPYFFLQDQSKEQMQRLTPQNVYGEPLRPCTTQGMAPTGFDRGGFCTEHADDKGSHHVCITDVAKKVKGSNFCEATGQPDWCDQENRERWCVCEWAFETYASRQGCEAIEIDCEATNQIALTHYQERGAGEMIECIRTQCALTDQQVEVS